MKTTSTHNLLIYPFLAYVVVVSAETGRAYHGPAQARESFVFKEKEFYLYSDKVSWDEANAICASAEMHLAILDDSSKAKFAAESIAEAWQVFEDLWIGGQKTERGYWQWVRTSKPLPDEQQQVGNSTYMYPPWIDNIQPNRDGRNCLSVNRNGHMNPIFIDLSCSLPRSFICEPATKVNHSEPDISKVLSVYDVDFILYHGRLSWHSAVSFCRQQGYTLATVDNMAVAKKLAIAMLKSRPEFEDMWIGAQFKNNMWIWIENGEELKEISADSDHHEGTRHHDSFPPWFEAKPGREHHCVLFDRHLCLEPKFIDLKCNRRRDFACMKRIENDIKLTLPVVKRNKKKKYTIFNEQLTWPKAHQLCKEQGENTHLLRLNNAEETRFIMQMMADEKIPIGHAWIGGRLSDDGVWVWVDRNDNELAPISMDKDHKGFPPWCENDINLDMACLNLDRQQHTDAFMYGLECNATQNAICESDEQPIDRVVSYRSSDHGGENFLRVTKLGEITLMNGLAAKKECDRNIGKLWQPNFQITNDLEELAKRLLSQFGEPKSFHVDGGRYNDNIKKWVRLGHQAKPENYDVTVQNYPVNGDCLVGEISPQTVGWTWKAVPCHKQLYAEIICDMACSPNEINIDAEASEWVCDLGHAENWEVKILGAACTHSCNPNRTLQGPESFRCKNNGWHTQYNYSPSQSLCLDVKNSLTHLMQLSSNIDLLVFILDGTLPEYEFHAAKYLVAILSTKYGRQLKQVYATVFKTDDNEMFLDIYRLNPTDCINFTNSINLLKSSGIGQRDFGVVLNAIKSKLGSLNNGNGAIVFINNGPNQVNSFKGIARELKKEWIVYAIGMSKQAKVNELIDLASVQKITGLPLSISYNTFEDFRSATDDLYESCETCSCTQSLIYLRDSMLNSASNSIVADKQTEQLSGNIDHNISNVEILSKATSAKSEIQAGGITPGLKSIIPALTSNRSLINQATEDDLIELTPPTIVLSLNSPDAVNKEETPKT